MRSAWPAAGSETASVQTVTRGRQCAASRSTSAPVSRAFSGTAQARSRCAAVSATAAAREFSQMTSTRSPGTTPSSR